MQVNHHRKRLFEPTVKARLLQTNISTLLGKKALSMLQIAHFSSQLAGLLRAGLPLQLALELVAKTHSNTTMGAIAGDLANRLMSGSTLSNAMACHQQSFDSPYRQMIALGEKTATLIEMLEKQAETKKRFSEQFSALRAALSYPIAVLFIAVALTVGLLITVVPTFSQLFTDFGAPLPGPTQFVIRLSAYCQQYGLITLIGILIFLIFLKLMKKMERWRLLIANIFNYFPIFGKLKLDVAIATWLRTLNCLLQSRLTLIDSLEAMKNNTGHFLIDKVTQRLPISIRAGASLSKAMSGNTIFPKHLINLIGVAEHAVALDTVLKAAAESLELQTKNKIKALTGLVEPLIVSIVGLSVGLIIFSLYLPIIQMGNMI